MKTPRYDISRFTERKIDLAIDWIRHELGIDTADASILDALVCCMFDSDLFGQTFTPHTYEDERRNTAQKAELVAYIDDETIPYFVASGWRGLSKTTLSSTKCIQAMVYRFRRFVLWIGSTADTAMIDSEIIKEEIIANYNVRALFGGLRAADYAGVKKTGGRKMWYLSDATDGTPISFFMPRGAEQTVRGLRQRIAERVVRPELVVVNDLEEDKFVDNEEHRAKRKRWFHRALLKCIDTAQSTYGRMPTERGQRLAQLFGKDARAWRFLYVDTLKHEDALLSHLLEDPQWKGAVFPLAEVLEDDSGDEEKFILQSKVPELFSDADVQAQWDLAIANNTDDELSLEMLCRAVSLRKRSFKKKMFRYYDDEPHNYTARMDVYKCVVVDPARTTKKTSAQTAFLAFAVDEKLGTINIRRAEADYLGHYQIIRGAVDLCVETGSRVLAVEDEGLGEHLTAPYHLEITSRGLDIRVITLNTRSVQGGGDWGSGREAVKRARAAQMVPFYEAGCVLHEKLLQGSPFERALMSFPKPKKWDLLDCLGYIPQIMELDEVIFLPRTPNEYRGQAALKSFGSQIDYSRVKKRVLAGEWRVI